MKIELSCGATVNVDKEVFDDMRVVDLLADIEDGNFLSIARLNKIIFTKEDKDAIYKALGKDNNGRVPVIEYQNLFSELMTKMGEAQKNS